VNRGEFYLVQKPRSRDPRKQRVFVIVSRKVLIDSGFSTVICAPVYSRHDGLSTQVRVGPAEGLKLDSSIHCDEIVSLPKSLLTHFVGWLPAGRSAELNQALATALELDQAFDEA
jgi:mRNA interferase MazF